MPSSESTTLASRHATHLSSWKECLAGGAAAVSAVCFTHPLDSIKVRALLHGEQQRRSVPARHVWSQVLTGQQPWRPLYNGLSAAVTRHAIFSTARFGIYDSLKRHLQPPTATANTPLPFHHRLLATSTAGATAAAIGCPLDAALVRMQADARLPASQRRNYRNVMDAVARTVREDGVRHGVYNGARPFILRSAVVTAAQFSTYEQTKHWLVRRAQMDASDPHTHVVSGATAGFCAAVVSTPLDTVKSRLMNTRSDGVQHGSSVPVRYTGAWDCVRQTFRTEGVRGFFKGFVPCLARMAPQVVLMWLFAEQYRNALR